MTDIRRHLPALLSCLRRHVSSSDYDVQAVQTELTDLLPTSYGIATGYLVNKHGQHSQSIDLIVYDRTIASNLVPDVANQMDLRRALAVVMLRHELDADELDGKLQAIASVKALRPIHQL